MRVRALLTSAVLLAATAVTVLTSAGPAAATVRTHASTHHPYSNPVWMPVSSAAVMNCMKNNPGCPPNQVDKQWSWDIGGQDEPVGRYSQKVYAMGAGIVHVLATGQGCGGNDENRGNTLYIDHGNGVISMYSHLAPTLLVRSGDYVSARTPIGYMGNSGYTRCHTNPTYRFVAVVVEHHSRTVNGGAGVFGEYVQVTHTYTCIRGERVEWPQQLGSGYPSWYHVRVGASIPSTDSSRSCIHTPPSTAPEPADAALRKASSTSTTASWHRPSSRYHVTKIVAQLQQYHPAIHAYTDLQVRTLKPTATHTSFGGLSHGHTYRLHVWFYNSSGWSRPSGWKHRTL